MFASTLDAPLPHIVKRQEVTTSDRPCLTCAEFGGDRRRILLRDTAAVLRRRHSDFAAWCCDAHLLTILLLCI